MKSSFVAILVTVLCGLSLMALANAGDSGSLPAAGNAYKILAPIRHGGLTIFPVVSARIHETSEFITLDEGIRSGQVVVTEVGNLHSSMRRRPVRVRPYGGSEKNQLVVVYKFYDAPLLLVRAVVGLWEKERCDAIDSHLTAVRDVD